MLDMTHPIETIALGVVDAPHGVLVFVDPGLSARHWRGGDDPTAPDQPDARELVIEGGDAERAGRAYNREFDPLHLYDQTQPAQAKERFDVFAEEHGFDARARILTDRMPHDVRVAHVLDVSSGFGQVTYDGLWGIAALVPPGTYEVVGHALVGGEFPGRWSAIDVMLDGDAEAVDEVEVQAIMVDHGSFLIAALEPLGVFRGCEMYERFLTAIDASDESAAVLSLDGGRAFACSNRWGDGIFSVSRLLGGDGRAVRLRINCGTPKQIELMRRVMMPSLGVVVSRRIADDGEPIRFAERSAPSRPGDSGWVVWSGTEEDDEWYDPGRYVVMLVSSLLEDAPEFETIMNADIDTRFEWDDGAFVPVS